VLPLKRWTLEEEKGPATSRWPFSVSSIDMRVLDSKLGYGIPQPNSQHAARLAASLALKRHCMLHTLVLSKLFHLLAYVHYSWLDLDSTDCKDQIAHASPMASDYCLVFFLVYYLVLNMSEACIEA
jgi:hypothetical protein